MTKKTDSMEATDMMPEMVPPILPTASPIMEALTEAPILRVSQQVSNRLPPEWTQMINERELLSIYALLAYIAHNQNVRQDLVQMVIEAEFGVDHVAKIRREDYQRAIAFLVDLRLDDILN